MPVHFVSASNFRRWLKQHHASATEFHVAFHTKKSGKGGMTYPEAVDEALCFGWIDGIVRKIDAERYFHRFTPRRPGSIWSKLNVGHIERLTKAGKMAPAGIAAFAKRSAKKIGIYAFEQREPQKMPAPYLRRFKANKPAWAFFKAQAPWYQRLIIHKVVTAKRVATKERWLQRAIEASATGKRLQ